MSEDLIKRSDAAEVVYKALKTPPLKGVLTDTMSLAIALVRDIPSAERKKGEWTTEEVAEILARVLGDECVCNFNGIDEWLPSACKYADTECPTPKEKHGCWMQFLMQGGADMRGEQE